MTILTSESFICAGAQGSDEGSHDASPENLGWRETAREVLAQIQSKRVDGDGMNVGFLYLSDDLAVHADRILNLFRAISGIEQWVGSVGLGVCMGGRSFAAGPAIVAMVGALPSGAFTSFALPDESPDQTRAVLESLSETYEAPHMIVHGTPSSHRDPAGILQDIETYMGGFVMGGMASSRCDHLHFSDALHENGFSGLMMSQDIAVACCLSQGCAPIGKPHVITRCEENTIMELDGMRAFDVLRADIKREAEARALKQGENQNLDQEQKAEAHIAFLVDGSDTQDYVVRNVMALDEARGWMSVAHMPENGDRIMFVHRDEETVRHDLSRRLVALRARVQKQTGTFAPKGALYFACAARSLGQFEGAVFAQDGDNVGEQGFGQKDEDGALIQSEMDLLQTILGDVPLAGFYTNGEISNHRLYGFSAVLLLFL